MPKNVKEGGALTFLEPDLYAMRGDDKKDFWSLTVGSAEFTP